MDFIKSFFTCFISIQSCIFKPFLITLCNTQHRYQTTSELLISQRMLITQRTTNFTSDSKGVMCGILLDNLPFCGWVASNNLGKYGIQMQSFFPCSHIFSVYRTFMFYAFLLIHRHTHKHSQISLPPFSSRNANNRSQQQLSKRTNFR